MADVEQHPTAVPGFVSMEQLANTIGDLRYDALEDFLVHLANKLERDHEADAKGGRDQLAVRLFRASVYLDPVANEISQAWDISEPYYTDKK